MPAKPAPAKPQQSPAEQPAANANAHAGEAGSPKAKGGGAKEDAKAAEGAAAQRVFHRGQPGGKEEEEPVWRYIDNKEQIQGPFSANQMLLWYNMGFFEKGLLMLGTAKKLAPPHLPGELRAPVEAAVLLRRGLPGSETGRGTLRGLTHAAPLPNPPRMPGKGAYKRFGDLLHDVKKLHSGARVGKENNK